MTTTEKVEELLAVVSRLNKASDKPVDDSLLREIVALVLKNPLDEDRRTCQDQIYTIVAQRVGKGSR